MKISESSAGPNNVVERFFYYLGAALMLGLTGVILYTVAARYIFSRPPIWSEDVPRIIFVWMVFLTAGVAIRLGLNIRVVTVVNRLGARARLALRFVMHVLVVAFLVVFCWASTDLIHLNMGGTILSTGWSNAVFSIPLLIGGLVILAYQSRLLVLAGLALAGRIELDEDSDHPPLDSGVGLG